MDAQEDGWAHEEDALHDVKSRKLQRLTEVKHVGAQFQQRCPHGPVLARHRYG